MRKSETIELYKQGDSLYWESIQEFEEFSKELVQKVKEELNIFGLDGSLAYNKNFAKAWKEGLITINRDMIYA